MKRYESIGELLIDYRELHNLSQADFADKINVDIRTVQRWERGETLIKPEKEEEIVVETFLPYQLVRNLNAAIVIPTYYDFKVRKYSLNEVFNEIPDAYWFKQKANVPQKNIRTIDFDFDRKYLIKFLKLQKEVPNNIIEAIKKSVKILPELNVIITDDSGYYSGHSLTFPISMEAYNKLKNKEIDEHEITAKDVVNYKNKETIVIYNYDITVDNNFGLFYMATNMLKFFKDLNDVDYIYGGYVMRYDTFKLNEQLGMKIAWEEKPRLGKMGIEVHPRFYYGDFKEFLKT